MPDTEGTVEDKECQRIYDDYPYDAWQKIVAKFNKAIFVQCRKKKKALIKAFLAFLGVLYCIYLGYAFSNRFGGEASWRLVVLTIFLCLLVAVPRVQACTGPYVTRHLHLVLETLQNRTKSTKAIKWSFRLLVVGVFVTITVLDIRTQSIENLIPVGGIVIYIMLLYITSINPVKVKWSIIFWGIFLQYFLALLILRTTGGYYIFKWLGDRIFEFTEHVDAGSVYVFGEDFEHHYFSMKVLPTIVLYCTVINVLYYLGAMQAFFKLIGRFLALCLDTSPAESICAGANIFLSPFESMLVIRPFLASMTKSELHAAITCGYATIANALFGIYIGFGIPGNHLLAASVMSAPVSLAVAKLSYPERKRIVSTSDEFNKILEKPSEEHLLEAITNGASQSKAIIGSILCNYIAFLGLLSFVNGTLTWAGHRIGMDDLTFQFICSYLFYPVSFMMGIDRSDCRTVSELIGIRLFLNEFLAYGQLRELMENRIAFNKYTDYYNGTDWYWQNGDIQLNATGGVLRGGVISERSEVIAIYALCGFANIGFIGAYVGGISALAPSRQTEVPKLVVRALVCGNVVCFVTACTAVCAFLLHTYFLPIHNVI